MRKFINVLLSAGALFGAMLAFGGTANAVTIDYTRDCDTVAVVKCGTMSLSEAQDKIKKADVPKIYSHMGINVNDVKGNFEEGVVWKDGRITLGKDGKGALVATGAKTVGRWNNPTSDMKRISGTDRAYEMSTKHFVTDGQAAMIKIVNGKFAFAIIKSCGNPVKAVAVLPSVICTNLAVSQQSRNQFTFRANGEFKNATFKHVTYTVRSSNGQTVGSPIRVSHLNAVNYTQATPGAYTVEAVITAVAFGQEVNTAVGNCKKSFNVTVEPLYTCDSLMITSNGTRTKFLFTTKVTTRNATFSSVAYQIFDGTGKQIDTKTSNSLSPFAYDFLKEGKYSVKAIVTFSVEGKLVTANGNKCVANVEVPGIPVTPLFRCDKLSASVVNGQKNTVAYTLSYVADGGATLTKVMVNYGDGKGVQEVTLNKLPTFNYVYDKPGTYNTTATLTFTVKNDNVTTTKTVECSASVTITEFCTLPGKEHLPVNSPECAPCPHNNQLPKDSPDCKAPETPTKLVSTGPGEVIGMVAATTVAATIAHKIVWARRYNS